MIHVNILDYLSNIMSPNVECHYVKFFQKERAG